MDRRTHKRKLRSILKVFNRFDPIGVGPHIAEANEEYLSQAMRLLTVLPTFKSVEELEAALGRILIEDFRIRPSPQINSFANCIWETWQEEPKDQDFHPRPIDC